VPHLLDTNILLYSISGNPADAVKRDRAIALLDRDDGALSVQVLQGFYVQATRATRTHPLTHETAAGLASAWTRFKVQEITLSILTGAFVNPFR
jgi:predicted nucleic acid-binding protein